MKRIPKTPRVFTPIDSMRSLIRLLAEHGDKTAFRYFVGSDVREMTYIDFSSLCLREAAAFHTFERPLRIAVIGDNSPFWLSTYISAIASGNVIVPMDKELSVDEIGGFFETAAVDAVVYSSGFNQKMERFVGTHPTVRWFIPIDAAELSYADREGVIPLDALLARGDAALAAGYVLPEPEPERMAVMLFTSGTTGTSKCVCLRESNVVSSANAACATVNFSKADTTVSVLPIHHTYELCVSLAELIYGITIAINDSLRHVIKNMRRFQPTGMILVPLFVATMHKKIFEEARKSGKEKKLRFGLRLSRFLRRFGIDLRARLFADVRAAFGGRLEKIICGGAPLDPQLVEIFDEFGIQIAEGYGITECSPLVAVTPYYAPKPGSVGPAVPGCTVRIDGGTENERGYREGEICVHGDNVMIGYLDPAQTAAAMTEDGWFRTGDIGYLDGDGYIYITGRLKSVIISENGKNVFPEELEEYLGKIDTVLESVVVGRPDPDNARSLALTAIIVPDENAFAPGTSHEEMEKSIRASVTELNRHLVAYKKLQHVEFRYTEFEKTTSRKIKRHLVK